MTTDDVGRQESGPTGAASVHPGPGLSFLCLLFLYITSCHTCTHTHKTLKPFLEPRNTYSSLPTVSTSPYASNIPSSLLCLQVVIVKYPKPSYQVQYVEKRYVDMCVVMFPKPTLTRFCVCVCACFAQVLQRLISSVLHEDHISSVPGTGKDSTGPSKQQEPRRSKVSATHPPKINQNTQIIISSEIS
jgi:hypothetical protein